MTEKTQNKGGRPSKLTPEVEKSIVNILRLGLSERTAAEFVEVDHSTFERWKKRVEGFATTIKKAEAEAKVKMTTRLVTMAGDNVTALIFWLKTRAKEEFTERQEIDFTDHKPLELLRISKAKKSEDATE
tara:strand:+ start:1259 stop:1648 length:390 start_codon:yes stop_codon:yes gene_type:complete